MRVWPPSVLALIGALPNQSLAFTLARMTAPASCSRRTAAASRTGQDSASAVNPPVVGMPATSMVSLTTTGMPCSRPRAPLRPRSRSSSRARCKASGLRLITALMRGPRRSYASIRSRQRCTSRSAVSLPSSNARPIAGKVASDSTAPFPDSRSIVAVWATFTPRSTHARRQAASAASRSFWQAFWHNWLWLSFSVFTLPWRILVLVFNSVKTPTDMALNPLGFPRHINPSTATAPLALPAGSAGVRPVA